MVTVAVLAVVVFCLVAAAVVDLRARRRGSRTDGREMATRLREQRRDLRAQRSTRMLGGDTWSDRRR